MVVSRLTQRRGPLLGPAQIEDLLTGQDHGAVDDPGHERRDLAGLHGHHRLVEQPHRPVAFVHPDQCLATATLTQRTQVRFVEALRDLDG